MKVGIVGCRRFTNYFVFAASIDQWQDKHGTISTIISGGAKGVDRLAKNYKRKHAGIEYVEIAPGRGKQGKEFIEAALARNTDIVNESDAIIAFPSEHSRGTLDTIRKAKASGKFVTIYNIREDKIIPFMDLLQSKWYCCQNMKHIHGHCKKCRPWVEKYVSSGQPPLNFGKKRKRSEEEEKEEEDETVSKKQKPNHRSQAELEIAYNQSFRGKLEKKTEVAQCSLKIDNFLTNLVTGTADCGRYYTFTHPDITYEACFKAKGMGLGLIYSMSSQCVVIFWGSPSNRPIWLQRVIESSHVINSRQKISNMPGGTCITKEVLKQPLINQ